MTSELKGYRYAHCEGHTDFCFSDDGSCILTCGNEGDIRIWKGGIVDDDPKSFNVGESAYSIVFHQENYYVDAGNCAVQAYEYPDHKPNGVVTRFTAAVTHLDISSDGEIIVAGSCDMTIHVCNVPDYSDKILHGHQAPILSVSLNPNKSLVASSSCDGTVKVWDIPSLKCIKSWTCLPKCNDFVASSVLCRMSWSSSGKFLALPTNTKVVVYEKDTWIETSSITDDNLKGASILGYSLSGRFLGCACNTGKLLIMKSDLTQVLCILEHKNKVSFSAFHWHPKHENEIALCDTKGQLLSSQLDLRLKNDDEDLSHENILNNVIDDDSEDDSISIGRIKTELGFTEDNGVLEFKRALNEVDDNVSVSGKPYSEVTRFTKEDFINMLSSSFTAQKSFQPGATPSGQEHFFMVWNNVGVVISHNSDDDNSIDIQFHDSSVYHAIHLSNSCGYQMGSLSSKALALASDKVDDSVSQLSCYYFASWDTKKDWIYELPGDECIICITVGLSWIAVATDRNFLRLFSLAGLQKGIFLLPGKTVAMASYENFLFITYHANKDIFQDQHLGWLVYNVGSHLELFISSNATLPLSPGSILSWCGFSDEGTPCIQDSSGLLSIFDQRSKSWVPICDTAEYSKGPSNFCFVIGISESSQNLRCILCKGSKYPRTLPFPTLSTFSLRAPLCWGEPESSTLEDLAFRQSLLAETCFHLSGKGFDVEEITTQADKSLKANLMKLFATACKNGQLARAAEIGQIMPTVYTLELAIKYASKLKLAALVNQLQRFLQEKSLAIESPSSSTQVPELCKSINRESSPSHQASQDSEADLFSQRMEVNPFLNLKQSVDEHPEEHQECANTPRNPFKKTDTKKVCTPRGTAYLDDLQKSNKPKVSSYSADKGNFQSWYILNKEKLAASNPGINEKQLVTLAMTTYKQGKRKELSSTKEENPKKIPKTASKLSRFSYENK